MDTTTLRVSSKRQANIKMALQGCAGSGKTYSALLLAYGLTKDWSKVTPRQTAFIQRILKSKSHIICTMRTKQDYVLNEKNGKMVPEKVGLKAVMRDGVDYELTIVLDLDLKHHRVASKDRTGLFMGKPEFTITPQTGEVILKWCDTEIRPDVVSGAGFQMSQQAEEQPRQYSNNKYQNQKYYGNNVYAQGRN